MNRLISQFTSRRGLASGVLGLLVYQLGACPCGCLEHNAWLQWAGVISDHGGDSDAAMPVSESLTTVSESLTTVANGDTHDCTGEPRPQYVDNAQSTQVLGDFFQRLATIVVSLNTSMDDSSITRGRFDWGPDCAPLAHALSRPALQVYRL